MKNNNKTFAFRIVGIQKLTTSKSSVGFESSHTLCYDFDISAIKHLCLMLLRDQYDNFKQSKMNNFDLTQPIKIIVVRNNKVWAVLTQEKVIRYSKVSRNNETPVIIEGNKFLLKNHNSSSINNSSLISDAFNTKRYFETIEFHDTANKPILSPVKSSGFESNKKKH